MNNIIEHQGNRYELVDVAKKCSGVISPCDFCHLKSECFDSPSHKFECIGCHCYQLIKKDEKSKMKFNELKFKVITGIFERNEILVNVLEHHGIPKPLNWKINAYFRICCGEYKFGEIINMDFEERQEPEITFAEAIKLLESCEPAEKKSDGKFVEYDIDENGCYHPLNDRGSSANVRWQDVHHYEDVNRIFAGWFWENPEDSIDDGWTLNRQGINRTTRSMTSICEDWNYPLIPKKIRFWVKE